jgi:tetratricopeptide (TPR) repeat protein
VWPRDLDAANALEQLYLRRADYQNLVKLLLRKAEIVDDVAEKKTLYFRAAQLHEEVIEDLESAVGVFQHVLSVDDGDKAALDQLERLYIRLARWHDLKNVYAKKAELATTPVEKKQMLFVLGQVYDRELGDPERAVETYSSIMDLDPEDYDARRRSIACTSSSDAGTTCSPCWSGRPSWRRRPPRWCRCATASASCGAST